MKSEITELESNTNESKKSTEHFRTLGTFKMYTKIIKVLGTLEAKINNVKRIVLYL